MKTTAISGAAYCGLQADMVSREGNISMALAGLFFQCAAVKGLRAVEEWDELVNRAKADDVDIQDAIDIDGE
jgi:hypothetical protein